MTTTVDRTKTLAWNSINVGDEVTPMDVPVTDHADRRRRHRFP